MRKKFYHDINLEDVESPPEPEDSNSMFGNLYEADDECPKCEYYGPMRPTRKGYRCPECRALVVRIDNDDE